MKERCHAAPADHLFVRNGEEFRNQAEALGWRCRANCPHNFGFLLSNESIRLDFYADSEGQLGSINLITTKIRAVAAGPDFCWAVSSTGKNIHEFLAKNPTIEKLAELGVKLLTKHLDVSSDDELSGYLE